MIMNVLILSSLVGLTFGFEDKTVTQYLTDNGFTTLVGALQTTGLASTLDGSGPYTIYAPTNAAFVGFNLSAYTREQLATILKYHVVREFVLVPMVGQSTNKTTLEGQSLTIEPSGGATYDLSTHKVKISINVFGHRWGQIAQSLLINGKAKVDSSHNDIIVNNGVVQPIDRLLSPPVFINDNIYQVLMKQDSLFLEIGLYLLLADLVSTIQGSEFTLFAPTNAAFEYYGNQVDPTATAAPNSLKVSKELLKYHIVPGARFSNQLKNGQQLYTLHGTPVNVTVGSGIMINNVTVVQADILASNGVIHAIDNFLVPQDFAQLTAGRK